MTDVPFMKMWWKDFFTDTQTLPGETRAVYALLLGAMWLNQGWLPDNDAVIAKALGMHLLTWKKRHKPLLTPLLTHGVSPLVTGGVWTQKRLTREWQSATRSVAENKAALAKARAEKAAKSRREASAAEPKKASVAAPVTDPVAGPVTERAAGDKPEPDKKGGPPPIARLGGSPFSAPTVDVTALPPRAVNGHAERSGTVRSPSLKGGSLPSPSDALLRSRLVGKRMDEDDEPEPSRPSGGGGLFGALEAAIRQGKSEDD